MKYLLMLAFVVLTMPTLKAQLPYEKYPVYTARDLGLSYTPRQSSFRIWAPQAKAATLQVYDKGSGGQPLQTIPMKRSVGGTWQVILKGDQAGRFYTFRVLNDRAWSAEVPDPYAKAVGINGERAMVVDLVATDPAGWKNEKRPPMKQPTDAVIYELHVRDASIAAGSGIQHKGKFAGLTEKGTMNSAGQSTGLDHLKELGVTHIHLLPSFDFHSVDESMPGKAQYNWGYDPLNYNVPEGSYATDAIDGRIRIRQFKELVRTFHENGLRVIMDVVYNHTAQTESSLFNQLVPGYYYRQAKDGRFSDATGCGNEIASERPMVRKFILESLKYWVEEYHIDGFRFDLMGVEDIVTMNLVSRELHRLRPDILLYGEGWTAGPSPLPDSLRALKANASRLEKIAVFSDDIRDAIKGSVFHHADRGFASGKEGLEQSIRFGIVAACLHPQVDYAKVNYSKAPYASAPSQTVTYAECHDNHTLWDKLAISAADQPAAHRKEMHKLALSIVLTSQGIAFLHAGSEMLRSKKGEENSYNAPDSINEIDWDLKTINKDVFDYVKALIRIRREHPAFRMGSAKAIASALVFRDSLPPGIIAYTINGKPAGDSWTQVQVIFNGSGQAREVPVEGDWKIAVRDNHREDQEPVLTKAALLAPYSCTILFR